MPTDFPAGHVIRRHRHRIGAAHLRRERGHERRHRPGPLGRAAAAGRVGAAARAHSIRMAGPVAMRTLYLDPALLAEPPRTCCVVQVGPLLRELILRAMRLTGPYAESGREAHLVRVLADELETARVAPLHLPMPQDPRLAARGARADRGSRGRAHARRVDACRRGERPDAAAALPRRDGTQLRQVAAAGAAAARARAPRGGRLGHRGRVRSRLRQPERLRHHVPPRARDDARPLLRSVRLTARVRLHAACGEREQHDAARGRRRARG